VVEGGLVKAYLPRAALEIAGAIVNAPTMARIGDPDSSVTAVLGPTNTGKTHLAVERMLGYRNGMIGFPLRLLAREVYDRIAAEQGAACVALITGEEKLVPAAPRYFICTVEAMPLDREFDFLAVDEIQLAADPDRGHVFTDRLLNARGTMETMFLGADTIRPLLRQLVPGIRFTHRPRLSRLTHIGHKKLSRLPPRSAVIAFSAQQVYEVAEAMRAHRGGCAVVLGALSPRTRNAQVELYQSGEIDFMVATDAIGMGLNMDLDHVAFSAAAKFDGHRTRRLWPAEIAQIAGRAGRHVRDGTFGTSAGLSPFDTDLVSAVEEHRFSALRRLYWRNAALDLRSLDDLLSSLDAPPPAPVLRRKGNADDHMALLALTRLEEVRTTACDAAHVRLLWETCQIPDYRKTLADAHVRLVSQIFHHLSARGRLPEDWMAGLIGTLDRTDGDIDTLTARISHVRTWTYIAHRGDWLDDSTHWQAQTRAIEDRLSDALHERLTLRFVDRRASALVRRIRDEEALLGAVDRNDGVTVEGHAVGRLTGFNFVADADVAEDRAVLAAARRILPGEVSRRAGWLAEDPDSAFALGVGDKKGSATTASPWRTLTWRGAPVARLQRGPTVLSPAITLLPAEDLSEIHRERVLARLRKWLGHYINAQLGALTSLEKSTLTGAARGLAFQLAEGLGTVPRSDIDKILGTIGKADRRVLRAAGVRLGRLGAHMPAMLKPARRQLAALLWSVYSDIPVPPKLPQPAAASFLLNDALPTAYYRAIGFEPLGPRALRFDVAERLAGALWARRQSGAITIDRDLLSLVGCPKEEFAGILEALGYRSTSPGKNGEPRFVAGRAKPRRASPPPRQDPSSPFAVLYNMGTTKVGSR